MNHACRCARVHQIHLAAMSVSAGASHSQLSNLPLITISCTIASRTVRDSYLCQKSPPQAPYIYISIAWIKKGAFGPLESKMSYGNRRDRACKAILVMYIGIGGLDLFLWADWSRYRLSLRG